MTADPFIPDGNIGIGAVEGFNIPLQTFCGFELIIFDRYDTKAASFFIVLNVNHYPVQRGDVVAFRKKDKLLTIDFFDGPGLSIW